MKQTIALVLAGAMVLGLIVTAVVMLLNVA